MANKTFVFILFVVFFSCQQTQDQKTVQKSDSVLIREFREQEKKWAEEDRLLALEKEKKRQEEQKKQDKIDSIHQDSTLQNAFKIAKTALHLDSFKKEYEIKFDSTSVYIKININYFFDNTQKLLTIKRVCYTAVYFDVYKIIENSRIEKWLNIDYSTFNSPENIFFDVNGDSFKDFVVHWTPISGCCRRNIYDVYLYLPQKNTLSEKFSFINPTFYPEEKMIRGVGYGRPGEAELYKYKWNGLKIDTVEFIYPLLSYKDEELEVRFVKTKKPKYELTAKDGIVLKEVPKEYWSVRDYDWFEMFKK